MKILRLLSVVLFATALSHQEAIAGPKAQSGPGIPVPYMKDLFLSPPIRPCLELPHGFLACICAITDFCTPNGPVEMTCEDLCYSLCFRLKSQCRDLQLPDSFCDSWTASGDNNCRARCQRENCPTSSIDSPPSP